MNDIEKRVTACFAGVFPGLAPSEIETASSESLPEWDSMKQIRLLSSLGEEFGFEPEMEDFDELVSYPLIVSYVRGKSGHPDEK